MTEANLSLSTSGGPVEVGSIRAHDAIIRTRGGDVKVNRERSRVSSTHSGWCPLPVVQGDEPHLITTHNATKPHQGDELSASNVFVGTGGGGVSLRRLIGQMVNVTTAGGAVAATSLYGERLDLRSGKGCSKTRILPSYSGAACGQRRKKA